MPLQLDILICAVAPGRIRVLVGGKEVERRAFHDGNGECRTGCALASEYGLPPTFRVPVPTGRRSRSSPTASPCPVGGSASLRAPPADLIAGSGTRSRRTTTRWLTTLVVERTLKSKATDKEPFMRELTTDERQELRRELGAVAAEWAQRLDNSDVDAGGSAAAAQEPGSADRLRTHLARMAVAEQMRRVLADLMSASAEEAVQHGAGYPELGAAVGASRQAARKRWPGLSYRRRASEWKQPPGGIGWAGSQAGGPGPFSGT